MENVRCGGGHLICTARWKAETGGLVKSSFGSAITETEEAASKQGGKREEIPEELPILACT